ncbi:N-acylneuraminate cytidylyltransferase [Loktanella ponticola]|uniref:N-acylneuraminate cytidylyltransferase n=1 Tax=Yoonia ponticola TaxID=1524255 RepID=A0A7W9BLC1_9RHOB|nr:acylneuraminate cytidylyltransferase family protein [Yoonia ponticola]MBB5722652.1 N-acylneuraminate cytidylyltransferase [Yoonia ponticola]
MIIGHIGARGGSKGVPGKNFKNLHGKPLIDWSLDQLFASNDIDHVVVSTDDPEMYEHGLKRGGLDIGLRPAHLANDTAGKWDVWQHALEEVEKITGPASTFIDLDCTSPLRLQEDLDGALALYNSQKPDMVMSCCESRKNPYFNILELDDGGSLHVSKPLPGGVVARQQAPKVLDHVGLVYILNTDYLRRATSLFQGRVIPYEVPNERGLDVDSPIDWEIIAFLMGRQIAQGLKG